MRSAGFSIRAKMLITFCLIIATVVAFSYPMFFVFRNRNNRLLYKVFRKCVGQPPAEYRRNRRRVS